MEDSVLSDKSLLARSGEDLEANSFDTRSGSKTDSEGEDSDVIETEPDPLPDGIYGMAMASLIRDTAHLANHEKDVVSHCIKGGRLLTSCAFIFISLFLQGYLIASTKTLITPLEVKKIRTLYGTFEQTMYDGHVTYTRFNHSRGIPGYFNASNFQELSAKDQNLSCRIPLSSPMFLFVILFIWTITCLKHIRNAVNLAVRMCAMPTVWSFSKALLKEGKQTVIVGLTCIQKTFVLLVQLAVFIINCFLLWLGARWLTSTLGFDSLLLNAIALEFILELPSLLYAAMIPKRTQLDTENLMVPHLSKFEPASCCSIFGIYFLGVLALIAVFLYMFLFEQVLPDYRHDVQLVCTEYLKEEMSFSQHMSKAAKGGKR